MDLNKSLEMATNGRFGLSSRSPDGSIYSNGQRGPYVPVPLDKSGSFRDASDRMLLSSPGTSKSSATSFQVEMASYLQFIASDLKALLADQKLNRPGEMKRALSSIFGASFEDPSSVMSGIKPLNSSLEEIRRFKNNLQERFNKARDRANAFGEASLKIEKYCHVLKKRSRVDSSCERSSRIYQGGSIPKSEPQNFLSGCVLEIGSQRLEEKAKTVGVPNRRVRTSLVEANGTSRTSGLLERDKEMSRPSNSGAAHMDENERPFSTGSDVWERSKMKKKRSFIKSDASTSSGLVRSQCPDREPKRGMQKLGIDSRPRVNDAHSIRSGSDNNISMVGKSDSSTQNNGPGARFRKEQNNVSLPNDRSNNREDGCAAGPSLLKFGSARGPRSNLSSLSKTSPNFHRVANAEDVELPQAAEKLNLGVVNRKRSVSVRSSSPPVGQWALQRPQKVPRSLRRSSLSPLLSSHDELTVSDSLDEAPISHDGLRLVRHTSLNASQQSRMSLAPGSLSESEESGAQEIRPKVKGKKRIEMDNKPSKTVQKFANLISPTRKNRISVEEGSGDGDRLQGKIGRGFITARSGMSATIDKLGDAVTVKQQRSARHGSERVESKPGRLPIKKSAERKGYTRPRHSISLLSFEPSDETADDHEELVAAANAALDTGRICSSTFWKQIEPVFRFVSPEDTTFLRELIQLTNVSAARINDLGDDSQNIKVEHRHSPRPSAQVVNVNASFNGINFFESERVAKFEQQVVLAEPFEEQFRLQSGPYSGVSICQALLSAIIGEEDMDYICKTMDYEEPYIHNDSFGSPFELDKDLKTKGLNLQLLDDNLNTGIGSDGYKVDANWSFCGEVSLVRSGANGILLNNQATPFSTSCTELQYNQMTINERLMLELSEIGFCPEPVPDLTYRDDEDIMEGIHILEEKLNKRVASRKNLLFKLEKAVMDTQELQQRELHRLVINQLVLIGYDRYKAYWGHCASGSKNATKSAKHAALAFIKRTLARCQKFEETGISSFSDPILKDIFHQAFNRSSNSKVIDHDAHDRNQFVLPPSGITKAADSNIKCLGVARPMNQLPEFTFNKENNPLSNRMRKEMPLDDVIGNSISSNAKGKRSERDRDGKVHNRERKNKTKQKLKPTSVDDATYKDDSILLPPTTSPKKSSKGDDALDLSHLQIPGMDVGDFGSQVQDIDLWLNFEEEGLQDLDCVGLEIPMDDLSEVHMMI